MSRAEPVPSPAALRHFGALLRYLRRRISLTQGELAAAVGCSERQISRLEQGQPPPDRATLRARFVPALGLDDEPSLAEQLLSLAGAPPAQSAPDDPGPSAPGDSPPQARRGLLATKLFRPRARPDLVPRPRLLAALDAALSVPLTLVAAPAGFGKTTLLSSWLQQAPAGSRPSAWLALDEHDNDPVTFARYLVAAIQTFAPDAGADTLALARAPLPPAPVLLAPLINDLAAASGELVLALDDYHLIGAQSVHACVVFLAEHLPPHAHLVIASREDPPLPLARLRARGQILELRSADLRFTADEAERFLREAMQLAVTPEQVAAVEAHIEGWAAGLQLAALALRDRGDPARLIAGLTGSNRYVIDYLAAEVLDQLPAHLRAFLVQTAILDRMCGPLCDAVLGVEGAEPGDAASYSRLLLQELERRHLFVIPLDDERRWYRYHHLFAAFLRVRLREGAAERQVAELHRRAGAWFAQQGLVAEAVAHTLASGDLQRAADLIESAALELTMLGQSSTVNDWLRALPGELAAARPRLCLALIWGAFGRAEFAAAAPSIGLMERALAGYAGADAELLRAELAAARSILYGYLDDPRAAELGRQALAVLPPSYPAYGVVTVFYGIAHYRGGRLVAASEALERALQRPEPALHMLVNRIGLLVVLASTRRMQGRLDAALALAREAERLATRGDRLFPSTATARSLLEAGGILRERNRLDEAERCLSRCVELCDQFAGRGYRIIAHFYLAQVRQSRGDLDGAQALLDQALAELQAPHIWPAHPRELEGYRVLLALARGDIATAAAWAAGYRPPDNAGQGPMTPFDYDRFALARLQMAQGRWDAAHASLARLEADAEAGAFGYFLIWARCLQALCHHARGDGEAALTSLGRALAQAAPEGYVRVFADEGPPMATLLRLARARGIEPAYCAALLGAFPGAVPAAPDGSPDQSALVEPLTARELEVLRLIAAGASNQGVADALILSVGTVKKHVNNILGKLGVHSRTQALARARDLGLL